MQQISHKDSPTAPASPADWSAWASVPWTPLTGTPLTGTPADSSTNNNIIGWHKPGVSYHPGANGINNPLQTLDVWLPTTASSTLPDPASLPQDPTNPGAVWVIYIHGGAWRDPRITSSSFTATATALLQSTLKNGKIAGLASLNYRLSPHPAHPTLPQNAQHPDHIADVLAGLSFLQRLIPSMGEADGRYVLTGHSCGATLALQAVMDPGRWGLSSSLVSSDRGVGVVKKPAAVVGFNGLYDLAGFVAAPPAGYEGLREAYEQFTRGAFGGEEGVWRAACPTTAEEGWVGEWIGTGNDGEVEGGEKKKKKKKKKVVVLVQSREDTLVPYRQLEGLKQVLERDGRVEVRLAEAGGDHNDIWEEGVRMGQVLAEVVDGLV